MGISAMSAEIDVTGQVAIITGGGRGLGRAYAQALAGSGAAVAVVARSEDQLRETVQLIEGAGGHAIALPADVTDQHAIERVVAQVERQLGPVDLLVNNAGIIWPSDLVWEVNPDQWWRCMDVNLRGSFLCARAVLPGMIARHRGRIINVSSGAGLGPIPYGSAYVVSKTAVIRLTENLAAETREHGVSAFAIHPGTVRTPMTEAVLADPRTQDRLPWFLEFFEEGRDAPPEHAVNLILLLASGRADALSGCFISIHHDVAEMVQRADEIQRDELYTLRLST